MAAGGRGNPISQVVLRRPADPGTFGYESRKGGYGRRGFRGNPIPQVVIRRPADPGTFGYCRFLILVDSGL